jgi:hypothetical protein
MKNKDLVSLLQDLCQKKEEEVRSQSGQESSNTIRNQDGIGMEGIEHIPLEDVDVFLSTRLPKQIKKDDGVSADAEKQTYASAPTSEALMRVLPHSVPGQRISQKEVDLYKMYARIGEYTRESDVKKAGLSINSLVAQGTELLNLLPVVFVTLGRALHSAYAAGGDHLVFFKLPIRVAGRVTTSSASLQKPDSVGSSQVLSASTSVKSQGRKPAGVQKHKKRKLEDVLSAFS